MTARPISRFPVPDVLDLPQDLRDRFLAVQERSGFIPNVFLTLAHRPAEARAFLDYHDALMDKDEGISKAEREMIVVATSGANNCLYCVVAHGAILRIRARDPLVADQVAVNYRKADITLRQRAMLDFAMKISQASATVGDGDFADLYAHGFTEEDAWDIGAIAAFFALSNRMANLTSMRPNDEFFLMGRLPRQAPPPNGAAPTATPPAPPSPPPKVEPPPVRENSDDLVPLVVHHAYSGSALHMYDAWLTPDRARRFLFATPAGRIVHCEIDPVVGGRFRIVDRRGEVEAGHNGQFVAVERPRRLVFDFWVDGYEDHRDRITLDFEPTADGCIVSLSQRVAPEHLARTRAGWESILRAAEGV